MQLVKDWTSLKQWSPVRWMREHRLIVDIGIAVGVTVVALIVHFHQRVADHIVYREPTAWTVALVVCACLPLAGRRLQPIPSAIIIVATQMALDWSHINGPNWVPTLFAFYALGSHATGRARLAAVALLLCAQNGNIAFGLLTGVEGLTIWIALGANAMLMACFFVGDNMRRRRMELDELADRAERAEREREFLAGQRVIEERTRIARELHDVVAHSVSVMVIQASAARRNIRRDRDAAEAMLANVEDTGRQTMRELRQILGVLRDADEAAPVTVPMICDFDALVSSIPELEVRMFRSGSLESVPMGVAMASYRVVQEALTNAHRHAGPNVVVDVVVACRQDRVEVSVTDNGRGASTRLGGSDGYGLIGMSERVAAFGGTLTTGPHRTGGWEVRARFPLEHVEPVRELAS